MNIKELTINGGIPPFIATDTVEFGGGSEDGGRKQAPWHGPVDHSIEGDIPIIEGADELGGIKFGEERTGIWPSGGGGRNIDPTDTIEDDYGFLKFGNQHYDGIKFGETGEGIKFWPTGGGGENIDEADGEGGIKFGGTGEGIWPPGIDWPPGDTIPGLPIQTVGGTGP